MKQCYSKYCGAPIVFGFGITIFTKEYNIEGNQRIYLHENSNISTGGDSIDQTDDISEGYEEMAVQAAKAAGAVICGGDMVTGDTGAAIIELNFNPAIHIHCYPFKGENRQIGKQILDLLFER